MNAHEHRCNARTIDYSRALQGLIRCEVCPRRWQLSSRGWYATPKTERMP